MEILPLAVSKLEVGVVQHLVEDRVPESRTLEYKFALSPDEKGKREFLYDVTAFANTQGGVILYGVDEERIAAWERLPEAIKAGILALVQAAGGCHE